MPSHRRERLSVHNGPASPALNSRGPHAVPTGYRRRSTRALGSAHGTDVTASTYSSRPGTDAAASASIGSWPLHDVNTRPAVAG